MKIKILGLTAVLMCFFGIGSTHVSALDFDHKTDFILNDSTKSFVLENISDVPAIDYILGYQFTILGANTCSVEIKLQRMGLTGEYTTLSTKQFSGSWFDFSAQDKVSIDPFHRYRILAEEHSENCTSVRVKGSYGIQYFHFD
ncbi:hypothetical protein [Bacillus spizizenii]|uniref:YoaW, putative n=1 Tax=Bacillus spizizenii (strain DSM 15029 / JCM 12233 / NBRC 101239 / NRRL B-23049 / TU-B-10) TaxID=1052585 RepID=G4NVV2_BACS4|nr:hypothetical protein [Bacillus spizizenii]MBK4203130.1 hypothetical protein [Bacillus subtilis]AEP86783.1 YoaW, putative [Bacillus spizizenii TU-B-10]MCI4166645.1 hypothetical protein [Bacillus spizizenii]MEC1583924.1 hypothetical protein [Bacillus spizizenii]OPG92235.1 hypothetical protein B2I22_04465 [Bacillus spizizenii]